MSQRVKIGGVRKNPAIDKINSLKAIDVKNYIVGKMEQLLIKDIAQQEQWRDVTELPLDFSKAAWKRKNAEMG
jgi:hypothetical protein